MNITAPYAKALSPVVTRARQIALVVCGPMPRMSGGGRSFLRRMDSVTPVCFHDIMLMRKDGLGSLSVTDKKQRKKITRLAGLSHRAGPRSELASRHKIWRRARGRLGPITQRIPLRRMATRQHITGSVRLPLDK